MKLEHTFTGVFVCRRDRIFVSAESDELDEDHALIFRWRDSQWAHWPITNAVAGLCAVEKPELNILCLGTHGEVSVIKAPPNATEYVDTFDDGPSNLPQLRCVRVVGDHAYAAGMARRVYRREGPGHWRPIDQGVRVPRSKQTGAAGFQAIDGTSENAIFAVGNHGETWFYDGRKWTQEQSPTDVTLTALKVVGKDVYAAGMAGTLLRRHGGKWQLIPQDKTREDFWALAELSGQVYASTYDGNFTLGDGQVRRVEMSLERKVTTGYLDAKDGVLWSVGEKDLVYTDGKTWKTVPRPK